MWHNCAGLWNSPQNMRCLPTDGDRHAAKWSVRLAWCDSQLSLARWVPGATWTAQPWASQRLLSDHNTIWYRLPFSSLLSMKPCCNSSIWVCDSSVIDQEPYYLTDFMPPILPFLPVTVSCHGLLHCILGKRTQIIQLENWSLVKGLLSILFS